MKINALRSLFVGAALSASSLLANSVIIHDTANDGNIDGGEFIAQTSANGTFLTFCLENFVNVTPEAIGYFYTIDGYADAGGPDTHTAGPGDPISKGTAWLYEKFITNTLAQYDILGNVTGDYEDNHDTNAGLLQKAIWTLEDEYNYGANPYLTVVQNLFGATAYDDVAATSAVKVLNIWQATSYNLDGSVKTKKDIQSQLIYLVTPDTHTVPDSGMTAALLGLGLLSLVAFRRKL